MKYCVKATRLKTDALKTQENGLSTCSPVVFWCILGCLWLKLKAKKKEEKMFDTSRSTSDTNHIRKTKERQRGRIEVWLSRLRAVIYALSFFLYMVYFIHSDTVLLCYKPKSCTRVRKTSWLSFKMYNKIKAAAGQIHRHPHSINSQICFFFIFFKSSD